MAPLAPTWLSIHSVALDANPCVPMQDCVSLQLEMNDISVSKGLKKDAMDDLNTDHADFFKVSLEATDAEAPVTPDDPTTNATVAFAGAADGFA